MGKELDAFIKVLEVYANTNVQITQDFYRGLCRRAKDFLIGQQHFIEEQQRFIEELKSTISLYQKGEKKDD
jgi:hypothetical protein